MGGAYACMLISVILQRMFLGIRYQLAIRALNPAFSVAGQVIAETLLVAEVMTFDWQSQPGCIRMLKILHLFG